MIQPTQSSSERPQTDRSDNQNRQNSGGSGGSSSSGRSGSGGSGTQSSWTSGGNSRSNPVATGYRDAGGLFGGTRGTRESGLYGDNNQLGYQMTGSNDRDGQTGMDGLFGGRGRRGRGVGPRNGPRNGPRRPDGDRNRPDRNDDGANGPDGDSENPRRPGPDGNRRPGGAPRGGERPQGGEGGDRSMRTQGGDNRPQNGTNNNNNNNDGKAGDGFFKYGDNDNSGKTIQPTGDRKNPDEVETTGKDDSDNEKAVGSDGTPVAMSNGEGAEKEGRYGAQAPTDSKGWGDWLKKQSGSGKSPTDKNGITNAIDKIREKLKNLNKKHEAAGNGDQRHALRKEIVDAENKLDALKKDRGDKKEEGTKADALKNLRAAKDNVGDNAALKKDLEQAIDSLTNKNGNAKSDGKQNALVDRIKKGLSRLHNGEIHHGLTAIVPRDELRKLMNNNQGGAVKNFWGTCGLCAGRNALKAAAEGLKNMSKAAYDKLSAATKRILGLSPEQAEAEYIRKGSNDKRVGGTTLGDQAANARKFGKELFKGSGNMSLKDIEKCLMNGETIQFNASHKLRPGASDHSMALVGIKVGKNGEKQYAFVNSGGGRHVDYLSESTLKSAVGRGVGVVRFESPLNLIRKLS